VEVDKIMEQYEQPYNEVAEQVGLHAQNQQGNLVANQSRQLQYQMEEAEQNLAEAQLDCEQTLNKIYHLLKQDNLQPNADGVLEWTEIKDSKKKVLTEEGVEKIMQIMTSYINKETLLSNFDDKMIMRRMLEFSLSLSAVLFMKYEIYFRTPSLEECKDILHNRIDDRIKRKILNLQLMRRPVDEKQIEQEVLLELEPRIENEILKIKQEQTKLNLREFEMIFTQLRALVESTHNRAWKGEERGSLRRHFNISEVIGGRPQMPEKKKWGIF
jgi:hypothetical protein